MSKKFKILYDGTTLANGAYKNSNRSGIFFTSLNILEYMLKNKNLKVAIYIPRNHKRDLQTVLKEKFPNENIEIVVCGHRVTKRKLHVFSNLIFNENNNFIKRFFLYQFFWLINFAEFLYRMIYILSYRNYDAVFSPDFRFHKHIRLLNIKKRYTFLHDVIQLIFPQYFFNQQESWYLDLVNSINKKDNYFTNSENTRKDFIKYCPQIDSKKIHTVYLGCKVNCDFNAEKLEKVKEKYHIPQDKKYIFSLCTLEPRKNLIRQSKTFLDFVHKNNIQDLILVMGGGHWEYFKRQLDRETKCDKDKILQIGYVDDEDLPILYGGAEWFTYTSEYEGFGLPILEAMNCGCPVITSNNSSMPEVIGDSGQQITWNSDEEHIQAYEKYYFDEDFRKECIKKGKERAKMFSWDKTVDKMLEIMMK